MDMFLYKYKIQLEAPAIISTVSGDPNSCATLDYIPGNTIRGSLASAIQRKFQSSPSDFEQQINQLVLDDNIRFLPAYIEIQNKHRGYPTPLFIKQEKHLKSENYTNMFSFNDSDEITESYKSVGGYINFGISSAKLETVKTSMRMHHRRDRILGHASQNNGDLFAYEYLDEGQSFSGYIKILAGSKGKASSIINEIKSHMGDKINVGRSRRAGYGGNGTLSIETNSEREFLPIETNPEREFLPTDNMPALENDLMAGDSFILYLSTAYIGRDSSSGMCLPDYIFTELNNKFNNKIKLESSFTAIELIGGYNRKWQSEIPQMYAMKAGSAIKFKALQDISKSEWQKIEADGLGIRKNEGFGNIVFINSLKVKDILLKKPGKQNCKRPEESIPQTVKKMEKNLLLSQVPKFIDKEVVTIIRDNPEAKFPPGNLLGRFRNIFYNHHQAFNTINDWLGDNERIQLKRPARKHLEKCFFRIGAKKVRLDRLIINLINEDGSFIFTENFFRQFNNYVICSENIDRDYFDRDSHKRFAVDFLSKLFNTMALKNRRKE
jgi:CRISPR-associated protein Csx10